MEVLNGIRRRGGGIIRQRQGVDDAATGWMEWVGAAAAASLHRMGSEDKE